MTDTQQKATAKHFSEHWKDKGYEKGESQPFWLSLLRDVYGVTHPEEFISFEDQVHLDHTSFIDGTIASTRVLIEQKGLGKDMKKPIKQSDGTLLTPFQQAKRYITELPLSQHPRWVVTCNFSSFYVYDMERPGGEPEEILLSNLPTEYYRLSFLTDTGNVHLQREMEISMQAGEIVGVLYEAFLKQYGENPTEEELKSLNVLCVRLVFCLYAEDAGIFGKRGMFQDYLASVDTHHTRKAIIELFQTLNTKPEERDKFLEAELAQFPYVNGGLFADDKIEVPPFTDEMRDLLLNKASADFNWSEISPTIFGAVFESTLNPETRRSGGMHYTSIENIHKVINPLFLNDLEKELSAICEVAVTRTKKKQLEDFQAKLASLSFLDPACGSGNFLTETYLSLRRLENTAIAEIYNGQIAFDLSSLEGYSPIKVTIGQFYGIEINDFAVTVAKTALWIAESQMMKATEEIVHMSLDFLPLRSYANIVEGNALRVDWEDVVPKQKLNYIMGNPPFVGKKYQSASQKADMKDVFGSKQKGVGNLDYVTAWYRQAAGYMSGSKIIAAFVSTNSIVQGEHIPLFWKSLYEQYPVNIMFAHQTFKWSSEAKKKAAVHCVIIGFCVGTNNAPKWLYLSGEMVRNASNIHPYLLEMPNVFIENRGAPLFESSPLVYGSFALDDGNYTISADEYAEILEKEPFIESYLKLFIGSEEFINNKKRYCIWLKDADIKEIKKSKILSERISNVQKWRSQSGRKETVAAAQTPMLFAEIRQPESDYLAIPITSSERRRYIPMGYMTKDIIASNHLLVLPNATLYEFGVLMSNVHMAWTRTVCGRLEMRYNYSARIVYNNYPWCNPTPEQRKAIEKTAQGILDARNQTPQYSLADMYDPLYMPTNLLEAHRENDRAVMQAYGFSVKDMTETSCVAALMERYQELTRGGQQ
jgi:type I restriction-modification system DNA methylase subunit